MKNASADASVILLVDDDPGMRLLAGEFLRRAGHTIVEAESAEAALEIFAARPCDLVLLDVVLPGIDGFEACRRLRQMTASVPIVILTSLDDKESINTAAAAGASDFLTKPIAWDLLPYRIAQALRAARNIDEIVRSRALLASAQRIARLGSWEWLADDGSVRRSDEMFRIFAVDAGAVAPELTGLLPFVAAADRQRVAAALMAARGGTNYCIEYRIDRPDGSTRDLFEQTEIDRDGDGRVVRLRGITQDVSERVAAAAQIRHLAYFDSLTGLANRLFFRESMRQTLLGVRRGEQECAVLHIDLDRFTRINETLGHEVGDRVLKIIAERIGNCLRVADIEGLERAPSAEEMVARPAADEFIALFVLQIEPALAAAARVARRVLDEIAQPIYIEQREIIVTASAGIALYPRDGDDVDELLRHASTAMHSAKLAGSNEVLFYDISMSAAVERKLDLENDLRGAAERGELRLFYQAKVDIEQGAIIGAEALMRWQHPQRGLVSPVDFIPIAEESGLIIPMTHWVLREACTQMARWRAAGLSVVPVSVNLSTVGFRDRELVPVLAAAIAAAGIGPDELECEVTESLLMGDVEQAVQFLGAIRELGVAISVDDFGTGYSSLAYLKRLPIDVLKVDRSFVKDVEHDPDDAAIASAIIAMAQQLRMSTVAEGVETPAQVAFLRQRGCRIMQGFLFARPLPADEFARLLADGIDAAQLAVDISSSPARL